MTDMFLRKEVFENEPWYNEFLIFCAIGICTPKEEHCDAIQKALSEYGYKTRSYVSPNNGKIHVVGC